MQKLGFFGMKGLDQFKSLTRSASGTAKALSISSRSTSDSITSGGFASLKLTAEKLVKEQASVRTDLDLANSKLKKSLEHIHVLEEKLQAACNENAKLKVKQKEDEKHWQGLESKFSSTKTLCDQLSETLQLLACQVQDDQVKSLSLKLDSAEEKIRERDQAFKELKEQKEEREVLYEDVRSKTTKLMEEKDSFIKCLEADLTTSRLTGENLKSKFDDASIELKLKEEDLTRMRITLENLEREKVDLQSSNSEFVKRLATSVQETQNLKDVVNAFASKLIELDEHSVAVSDKISQLCSVYDKASKLAEQEKDFTAKCAQGKYGLLHHQHLQLKSEKDELQSVNQGLKDKVDELQRAHESSMVQHAEECRLSEERIRTLESEVEALLSKKFEAEKLVADLRGANLLIKLSELELEKTENMEKLQGDMHKKEDEIDGLQKEILKINQEVKSFEEQVNKLSSTLEEKEQLILQYKDKEKELDNQKAEAQLAAAEGKLGEAKKQYDAMLESKQSELSRHLKEISQRNDQAINDIRKKYEVEKQEIINLEKEKADKAVAEMERACEQRLDKCNEESRQNLARIQEEHIAQIDRMKKEHERKESNLKSEHLEEMKNIQLHAENELREKTMTLRNEHESQIRALRLQHEDECKQFQQELDLQKSKEERQRALLQLQWKVMSDIPQEDQEANSKKEYSVSSIRRRDPDGTKRRMPPPESRYEATVQAPVQSPVSTLLRKVGKENAGNRMDMSKHGRKVTNREFEEETTSGGGITKRRKTRSTVMLADPRKHKKVATPKVNTPKSSIKGVRAVGYSQPTNIGELFSEGSLNPYADGDDPYAFD
uniref:Synaptonemal complex protein 1 n=1 Tax=Chenopodium quinoa TaxID=63459 RepID=A0A803N0N5_CHEQI